MKWVLYDKNGTHTHFLIRAGADTGPDGYFIRSTDMLARITRGGEVNVDDPANNCWSLYPQDLAFCESVTDLPLEDKKVVVEAYVRLRGIGGVA